jgi:hypothetical protein
MSVGHIFRTTENGPLNDTAVKRAQDRHHAHLRGMDRGIDGLAPSHTGKAFRRFPLADVTQRTGRNPGNPPPFRRAAKRRIAERPGSPYSTTPPGGS